MMKKLTRRHLMRTAATTGALLPLAGLLGRTSAFAQAAAVDPNDPTAKALGYVAVSPKPDQKCAGCALYQGKPDDAQAGCTVFGGKIVVAGAWCKSWAKRG